MSRSWHVGSNDPQIDPFNAPDPIMPGGEPDFFAELDLADGLGSEDLGDERLEPGSAPRDRDGLERIARRNERREPGHHLHRASLFTPTRATSARRSAAHAGTEGNASPASAAPTSPIEHAPDDYDTARAGTPANPRHGAQRSRARRAHKTSQEEGASTRSTPGKRRSTRGCLILFIIFFILSGGMSVMLGACSAIVNGLVAGVDGIINQIDAPTSDDSSHDAYDDEPAYDYDQDASSTAEDTARTLATEAAQARLDAMIAGTDASLDLTSQAFSDAFVEVSGITPEQAGIDPAAVARWALGGASYELDSAYAFSTATADGFTLDGSVYYDIAAPEAGELVYDLYDYLTDIVGYDALNALAGTDTALSADATSALASELARLQDQAATREVFLYLDYTGTASADGDDVSIELVESLWESNLRSTTGLY